MIQKFYNPRSVQYLDFNSLNEKIDSKVIEIEDVTQEKNGLMTKEDKTKLDGIAPNANNYTHPSSHSPSIITQDENYRFVTDVQIANWTGKVDQSQLEATNRNIETVNTNIESVTSTANNALAKAEQALQNASNGKTLMASAITGMGVQANANETFEQLSNKVKLIKTKAIFS